MRARSRGQDRSQVNRKIRNHCPDRIWTAVSPERSGDTLRSVSCKGRISWQKQEIQLFCKECGYESAKWLGQCPVCKEWNTFVEEPVAQTKKKAPAGQINAVGAGKTAVPVHISEISFGGAGQDAYGLWKLDRVLGSGIVKGSLVLVGGDPGIGKSTLLLQVCRNLAGAGKRVLYISGEESLKQIKMRANRIGEISGDLLFYARQISTRSTARSSAQSRMW